VGADADELAVKRGPYLTKLPSHFALIFGWTTQGDLLYRRSLEETVGKTWFAGLASAVNSPSALETVKSGDFADSSAGRSRG
jgi:hypothetical protein